jgi:hypothetical protein
MKPTKQPLVYRGLPCDSPEEVYFLMWAFELVDRGYIQSIKRADSIELFEPVKIPYRKVLKTKVVDTVQHLFNDKVYTPDFRLEFTPIGLYKLVDLIYDKNKLTKVFVSNETNHVLVEVKPDYDQNGKTAVFSILQKWTWQKVGKYVNLCKVPSLFAETFTPQEYMLTAKTKKPKKIKHKVLTCDQWLKLQNPSK